MCFIEVKRLVFPVNIIQIMFNKVFLEFYTVNFIFMSFRELQSIKTILDEHCISVKFKLNILAGHNLL